MRPTRRGNDLTINDITAKREPRRCYYQFINFVCDTGGQRQPHANTAAAPAHGNVKIVAYRRATTSGFRFERNTVYSN